MGRDAGRRSAGDRGRDRNGIEERLKLLHAKGCEATSIINYMITKRTVSLTRTAVLVNLFQSLTEQAESLLEDTSQDEQ